MTEKELEHQFRNFLSKEGWYSIKTHGGIFQSTLPDLYCMSKKYGTRWIELKTPEGKLSKRQMREFTKWWNNGAKIWIVTSIEDYSKLFMPPNFPLYASLQF